MKDDELIFNSNTNYFYVTSEQFNIIFLLDI